MLFEGLAAGLEPEVLKFSVDVNGNVCAAGKVGIGTGALHSNTTGAENTANGSFALYHNTEGHGNTASGVNALHKNTGMGSGNTASG